MAQLQFVRPPGEVMDISEPRCGIRNIVGSPNRRNPIVLLCIWRGAAVSGQDCPPCLFFERYDYLPFGFSAAASQSPSHFASTTPLWAVASCAALKKYDRGSSPAQLLSTE